MAQSHEISLTDAKILTQRYRNAVPSGTVRAFLFDKSAITDLFAQDNVEGLRVYLGLKEDGSLEAILVAKDNENNDLIGVLMNHAVRCPPECDLNSGL